MGGKRHKEPIRSLVGLPDDQQLTLSDVAGVLNVHPSTAYEIVVGGKIPFMRLGKQTIRVEVSALREYIASRRCGPATPRRDANSFVNIKKAAS